MPKKIDSIKKIIEEMEKGEFIIRDPKFKEPRKIKQNVEILLRNLGGWIKRHRPDIKKNILVLDHPKGASLVFEEPKDHITRGATE